jgi:hemoglobin
MTDSRPSITTEADVQRLVDTFYAKVNQDALLDPVFNGFAQVDWPRHLPKMYDFWSGLLLGTVRYQGRPFPKHLPLPIDATHLQRWGSLFRATVDELFVGPKAEEAKVRGLAIAQVFEARLRERGPFTVV